MQLGIHSNLDRLMAERRLTLTELAGRVGLTLANLSILKTNKARAVRFSTLAALCRELKCQPGDLLEYTDHTTTGPKSRNADEGQPERYSSAGLPGDYY